MNKTLTLFHTLRPLKLTQISGWIRKSYRERFSHPELFDAGLVPEFPGSALSARELLDPGMGANRAEAIENGSFSFVGMKAKVGFPPDWQCPDMSKLWRYNLHYFEWLSALGYDDARSVALDWIRNHPLAEGQVGWEPYPVSLRLINTCKVFWGKYRQQTEQDKRLLDRLWPSIYRQAQWLGSHLEVHLLGNHYFENGAALAFVGSCFKGDHAAKWLEKGIDILAEQIPEQILPDGLHFERSPMYHTRMLYLMAILAAAGDPRVNKLVTEPLIRMVRALKCVCHPDGQIALLNDSAFGIYNHPGRLIDYCKQQMDEPGLDASNEYGPFALSDAGYYGWRGEEGHYVICDAAPIGPDYIPGHAHADIFSFELSLRGCRVIVDSGVFDYDVSPVRQYCRSTGGHNTVEIEKRDQSEMWSAFRVARRGRPHDVRWKSSADGFELSAWHDGYKRLKGRPIHRRKFRWRKSGSLAIEDRITASCPVSVIARLHLHPDCSINQVRGKSVSVSYPAGKFRLSFPGPVALSIEESFYCPRFGEKLANKAIACHAFGDDIQLSFLMQAS